MESNNFNDVFFAKIRHLAFVVGVVASLSTGLLGSRLRDLTSDSDRELTVAQQIATLRRDVGHLDEKARGLGQVRDA